MPWWIYKYNKQVLNWDLKHQPFLFEQSCKLEHVARLFVCSQLKSRIPVNLITALPIKSSPKSPIRHPISIEFQLLPIGRMLIYWWSCSIRCELRRNDPFKTHIGLPNGHRNQWRNTGRFQLFPRLVAEQKSQWKSVDISGLTAPNRIIPTPFDLYDGDAELLRRRGDFKISSFVSSQNIQWAS